MAGWFHAAARPSNDERGLVTVLDGCGRVVGVITPEEQAARRHAVYKWKPSWNHRREALQGCRVRGAASTNELLTLQRIFKIAEEQEEQHGLH